MRRVEPRAPVRVVCATLEAGARALTNATPDGSLAPVHPMALCRLIVAAIFLYNNRYDFNDDVLTTGAQDTQIAHIALPAWRQTSSRRGMDWHVSSGERDPLQGVRHPFDVALPGDEELRLLHPRIRSGARRGIRSLWHQGSPILRHRYR